MTASRATSTRVAVELPALDLAQLPEPPVRVDEGHRPVAAPEADAVGVVGVARHVRRAGRTRSCPMPDHRPARGSSPSATGRVVGAQPIER